MQYKINVTPEQIEGLTHVFDDYPQHIKDNQLCVLTEPDDDSDCLPFLSMIKEFTNQPVSIDYMTPTLIKFVLL